MNKSSPESQPVRTPVTVDHFSSRDWLERVLPFVSVLTLFIALSITSPYFLTLANISSVCRQTAVITIVALGMTLVIISGGIDLSVGSVLAFGGICGTMLLQAGGRWCLRCSGRCWPARMGTNQFAPCHSDQDQPLHRYPRHYGRRTRTDARHYQRTSGR